MSSVALTPRRVRRAAAAVAAATVLTLAGWGYTAPLARAADVDYDCDEAAPGEQKGTVVGEGCSRVEGDPGEPTHIVVEYYGYDWACARVEVQASRVTGYDCEDVGGQARP
ncbi:hypothetical protein ACWGJ2_09480 [Streptomyces sp. NPDC054796]